jgi:hypothetical protein
LKGTNNLNLTFQTDRHLAGEVEIHHNNLPLISIHQMDLFSMKNQKGLKDWSDPHLKIFKQLDKASYHLPDGGAIVCCKHGPGMSLDYYRRTGEPVCIKQLLDVATTEHQQIYGEEAHLDDFINAVVLDLTQGALERMRTNKDYRFNPDHPLNRMTVQERMAYVESGGVGL